MRSLVLLWSCLMLPGYEALKGPKEISGFEGDSVSLQCTYEKKVRGNRKYWCRQGGLVLSRCSDIVYSSQNQEVAQGRMSIRDSPRQLSMTVTMRDLTLKDSGKYWCGIDRLGFDESFEVSLIVFPGSSRPVIWLSPTTAKDSKATRVSKSSVSIPVVRMMAPVWVLLSLLLAAGLIAFGSYMLPLLWRKKAWLATETQRNEKVHLAASPPGNTWVPEDAMINLAAPPEYLGNPEPSTVPSTETQHLSQTTEEEAAPPLDAEEDRTAAPPLQISAEELAFSEFISV
ncbi:CMRF35-like molecule 9 isoform X5 [Phodopus roborovskii]|uniref:Cd300lg protein n=1 Tax=Phodopus roborovskii TaxID=109678 RepID=A0AAU9YPB0_PHORO|nr:CMRF35-like molecule 9 isoform X5 [Phodopus roborovskii]CAH6776257.1 Cd300lg [Phodopus roborovskii]